MVDYEFILSLCAKYLEIKTSMVIQFDKILSDHKAHYVGEK